MNRCCQRYKAMRRLTWRVLKAGIRENDVLAKKSADFSFRAPSVKAKGEADLRRVGKQQ